MEVGVLIAEPDKPRQADGAMPAVIAPDFGVAVLILQDPQKFIHVENWSTRKVRPSQDQRKSGKCCGPCKQCAEEGRDSRNAERSILKTRRKCFADSKMGERQKEKERLWN